MRFTSSGKEKSLDIAAKLCYKIGTMKDYVNPILLLLVIVLMACRVVVDSESTADILHILLLSSCVTLVLVNGALALARALARRPSVTGVLWAGVFFVMGCFSWTLNSISGVLSEEQQAYQELYKQNLDNPLAPDAEGESLLTRAAALGQEDVVRDIISRAAPSEDDINKAGLRAAECNRIKTLDELAQRGMSAKATIEGTPLLHGAAQNAACEAMDWLLSRGANPNARDAEGATALIHATIADSAAAVKLLLEYGANPNLRDFKGMSPVDYARSEEVSALLNSKGVDAQPSDAN